MPIPRNNDGRNSAGKITPLGGAALAFGTAFAYRIAYFLSVRGDPLMTDVDSVPDAWLYHNWAVDILGGVGGHTPFRMGPLYAWFLVLVYKTFGLHFYAVIGAQLVLGALAASFVYLLARRMFNPMAAAAAAAVWVLYLPAAYFDTQILPASLAVVLAAAGLYFAAGAFNEGGRLREAFLSGSLFGLTALARPNLLLLVPFLVVWGLVRRPRVLRVAAAICAPIIIIAVGTAVYNKIAGDEWVLISSQGGPNFYIGNNADATGGFSVPRGIVARPEEIASGGMKTQAEEALGRKLTYSAASRWWFERGVDFLARNPAKAAYLYGRKLLLLTNSREPTLNTVFEIRKVFSPFHAVPIPYFGILFGLGGVGILISLLDTPPRNGRGLLACYISAAAASLLLFFVADWHRLLLAPALAAGAGFAIGRVIEDVRARRWAPAAAIAAAVGLTISWSAWPAFETERTTDLVKAHLDYGTYYLDAGDYESATRHYRRAVALAPRDSYALDLLGQSYDRRGRADLARAYYLEAIKSDPAGPLPYYDLALTYTRTGGWAAAIPYLERATQIQPDFADAWLLLGECYRRIGYESRAMIAFDNARRSGAPPR